MLRYLQPFSKKPRALSWPREPGAQGFWGFGAWGLGLTWRFMGTYTWGYNSEATILITLIRGLLTPPITAHEPPSRLFWG